MSAPSVDTLGVIRLWRSPFRSVCSGNILKQFPRRGMTDFLMPKRLDPCWEFPCPGGGMVTTPDFHAGGPGSIPCRVPTIFWLNEFALAMTAGSEFVPPRVGRVAHENCNVLDLYVAALETRLKCQFALYKWINLYLDLESWSKSPRYTKQLNDFAAEDTFSCCDVPTLAGQHNLDLHFFSNPIES